MIQTAMIQAVQNIKILFPHVFSILKIVGTTHSVSFETFNGFTYFIGLFITFFAGVFIILYLLLFSIFFIYIILYYLISKIDWIKNNTNKEFDLIENKIFIFYIIKYLFIIIFMAFLGLILKNIIPIELIYFGYYIFNSFHITLLWLGCMVFFYLYIYFVVIKKFSGVNYNIKNYVLLFIYRFLVFFILRAILYIVCPEEYTTLLSQGLISIFLFPNIILNILNKIWDIFDYIILVSPGITVAQAEGLSFQDYLDDKYTKDNPQRNPANYPRLMDIRGMPRLDRATNFTIEELFYRPSPNINIFLEEYTFFFARMARERHYLYPCELREVNFMCIDSNSPTVSMPVFIKFFGEPIYPLPHNFVAIQYMNGRREIFIYVGQRDVLNYIISEKVYTIKSSGSGNRENYTPLDLWHLNKKIYVDNLNGNGVLIGNSRGRIYDRDNRVAIYQEAFLREKYNLKCITD